MRPRRSRILPVLLAVAPLAATQPTFRVEVPGGMSYVIPIELNPKAWLSEIAGGQSSSAVAAPGLVDPLVRDVELQVEDVRLAGFLRSQRGADGHHVEG